jgi:glycosyltransferase involved in cell wall biosynthesis
MITRSGQKLCLVANTDWYLYNFRLVLARKMRSLGWEVVLISPPGLYAARIIEEGFRWVEWPVDRRGLNIRQELNSLSKLAKIYRQERPQMVHHFTVKSVLYGSLAARREKIAAIVNSITGLGYIFLRAGWRGRMLRAFILPFYRLALRHKNVRVIFENEDDQNIFLKYHLIESSQTSIIEGVGVDVEKFKARPEVDGTPLVVMPSRLLWDKGVGVFVEAARRLREGNRMRFALVGMPDPGNPASIDPTQLQKWISDGVVEHWGFREDMEEVYRQAHIVCLPSMGEGLPTVLIEAAASGRPIVASDVPGCREVVSHGENGLLVKANDPAALSEALRKLAVDPELRQKMGVQSRLKAVEKFASDKIIAETIQVYADLTDRQ